MNKIGNVEVFELGFRCSFMAARVRATPYGVALSSLPYLRFELAKLIVSRH
jgi:hypothetical protein